MPNTGRKAPNQLRNYRRGGYFYLVTSGYFNLAIDITPTSSNTFLARPAAEAR